MKHKKHALSLISTLLASSASIAGHINVTVEIPQLDVAEYHRPYVSAWIETPKRSHAANIAVWYDVDMRDNEGEKWLKDIRQWWRKSGRNLDMPIDGISEPTRPVGTHEINADLTTLEPGDYQLVVEASREVGGREIVRIPFSLGKGIEFSSDASGTSELGKITLKISE